MVVLNNNKNTITNTLICPSTQIEPQVHPTSMGLHHPMPDMASASVDRLPVHQQEEVHRREEGEW